MAQVISGGSLEFNALVYGAQHPNTQKFLENQYAQYQQLSPMLNDAGRQFFASYEQAYQDFSSSEAMRLARIAVSKVDSVFQRNEIRNIWDLAQLQNAPPVMQRFVMAEPTLRALYHEQRLDGYSDSYVDVHPQDIGRTHYDYRQAMTGLAQLDDPEHEWKVTIYSQELLEGDRPLSFGEKRDIASTWDAVRYYLERNEDPTTLGGKL